MKSPAKGQNRFEGDVSRYAAYLETPAGRLRADLSFANLQEFLPAPAGGEPLRALDLGCGTGAAAVRLAQLGSHVTLLDSSASMLELAERTIAEAGVRGNVALQLGDAAQMTSLFPSRSFDAVLCHDVLEFVDDPVAVLRGVAQLLRNSSSILSLLVRNQSGEVLKAALLTGDLVAAERNLTAEWASDSLYGGKVRLFATETLETMLKAASLAINARRGVRVIADYLPAQISKLEEFSRIFALERKLGQQRQFLEVARYSQWLAGCASPVSKGEA
jgi:S-adenosylmethionine-dependent methyltransferase